MLPVTALKKSVSNSSRGRHRQPKAHLGVSSGTAVLAQSRCRVSLAPTGVSNGSRQLEAGLGPRSAPSQRWGRITQLRAEFPRCLSAECFGTRRPRRDDRKLLHLTASCSAAKELRCAWQSAGLMRSGSLFQIVPG